MKTICIIVERESGVFYHRLKAPFEWLDNNNKCKVLILNGLDPANVGILLKEKVDELWFNRMLYPAELQADTIAKVQRLGIKVVCDVDDFWELPKGHIAYNAWITYKMKENILQALSLADVVTCTHHRLKAEVEKVTKAPVSIIANAIDHSDNQFSMVRNYPGKPLVFGWQGSAAHIHDIEIISDAVRKYQRNGKGAIILAGAGEDNKEQFLNFAKLWSPLGVLSQSNNVRLMPMQPVTQYGKTMEHFTACLIPIADLRFNTFKSNLKLLECAAKGLPAIVSFRDPYADDAHPHLTYRCANDNMFEKMMREVEKNLNEAADIGRKFRQLMREKYVFEDEAVKRLKVINE